MSKVINATVNDFKDVVLGSDEPVLVDFWAPWCGPCRAMAPILDDISDELGSKIKVVKIDVEDPTNIPLAQQYGIMSIPSMKLFKGGEVIHELVGYRTKEMLKEELKGFIA